jgi:hypothetical protein
LPEKWTNTNQLDKLVLPSMSSMPCGKTAVVFFINFMSRHRRVNPHGKNGCLFLPPAMKTIAKFLEEF